MDVLGRFLDPAANPGLGSTADQSPSFSNSSNSSQRAGSLDEEILLASCRPKKRAGRVVFKETRHPVYRGVRQRSNGKWVCELREQKKKSRIWLGTYSTPEMAARAHDVAALALRGRGACLNFADSAWRLRVPASRDTVEIQRAAAEAARAYDGEAMREDEAKGAVSGGEVDEKDAVNGGEVVMNSSSSPENTCFMEEEVVFGSDLDRLEQWKEGPLLSPQPQAETFHLNWEEMENDPTEMCLWSFSI